MAHLDQRMNARQLALFGVARVRETTKPSSALAPFPATAPLEQLVARANHYAADVRAEATKRAYATDFAAFEAWCSTQGLPALPATPATIAVYLAALADAGRKASTIERAVAGIAYTHRMHGHEWLRGHPAISAVRAGIRRKLGTAPEQKAPVVSDELARMVATLGTNLLALRDRAILTLGWFGAFRRSELVALTVGDVTRTSDGIILRVRRSKGDQEQRGAEKGVPFADSPTLCPVRALDAWLAAAAIVEGPLFRYVDRHGRVHTTALRDRAVADVVQRTAARAGLDARALAAHSLRAGFCTSAAAHGKSLDAIMRQTLHKSERVARGYIRHANVFANNAARGL